VGAVAGTCGAGLAGSGATRTGAALGGAEGNSGEVGSPTTEEGGGDPADSIGGDTDVAGALTAGVAGALTAGAGSGGSTLGPPGPITRAHPAANPTAAAIAEIRTLHRAGTDNPTCETIWTPTGGDGRPAHH